MASSQALKCLAFSLPLLLLCTASVATGAVFREYIGALYNGVKLSDVPINKVSLPVHLILAFAIDYTSAAVPTDGNFGEFWDTNNITPEAVAALKAANPNVKVAVSLGGATISGKNVNFSASSVDAWTANAVQSLTDIIRKYNLDGIDIDYENFVSDVDTFTRCIGGLITRLKADGVIELASIAPYNNAMVQQYYSALWQQHAADIDFVNFQFYDYAQSDTEDQFLSIYDEQKDRYSGGRLMASFSTDNSAPGDGFFAACQTLKERNQLDGIFVWCADSSKADGFRYEVRALNILV